jgi:hypothetical protein
MFFQTINGTDPEKIFIIVKNSYATAAITVGQVVCFDYTTDCDGIGVTQPSTALLGAVAGLVADASIAAGAYGLVQVYGHMASGAVGGGTTNVTAGHPLTAANASFTLVMATTTGVNSINTTCKPFFIAGEAYTTTAAAAKKVFIRCL